MPRLSNLDPVDSSQPIDALSSFCKSRDNELVLVELLSDKKFSTVWFLANDAYAIFGSLYSKDTC